MKTPTTITYGPRGEMHLFGETVDSNDFHGNETSWSAKLVAHSKTEVRMVMTSGTADYLGPDRGRDERDSGYVIDANQLVELIKKHGKLI